MTLSVPSESDPGMDQVFEAPADATRRRLLDRLHERGGQTLGELCEHIDMTRQSVTRHLAVPEAANLVASVRRGREKLHRLNPVPLQEVQERWIDKFERPRLRALSALRRQAEEAVSDKPAFVYVIHIRSTPEAVWDALTDAELTTRSGAAATSRTGSPVPAGSTSAPTARASPTRSARWSKASGPAAS